MDIQELLTRAAGLAMTVVGVFILGLLISPMFWYLGAFIAALALIVGGVCMLAGINTVF